MLISWRKEKRREKVSGLFVKSQLYHVLLGTL